MSAHKKPKSCATIGFWRVRYEALSRMTSFKIFQDYCLGILEFFGAQSSTLFQVMKFFDLFQDLLSCHCCSLRQRKEGYDREPSKILYPVPTPLVYFQPLFGKRARNPPPKTWREGALEIEPSYPLVYLITTNFKALRLLKEFLTNIGLFLLEEDCRARSKQRNEQQK